MLISSSILWKGYSLNSALATQSIDFKYDTSIFMLIFVLRIDFFGFKKTF